MYLLGYLASQSKVYLMDKDFSVLPYTLLLVSAHRAAVAAPLFCSAAAARLRACRGVPH